MPPVNDDTGHLLTLMMQDPQTHQDAFYRAFLTSNVFLIAETDDATPGPKKLAEGDSVRVMQWMDPQDNPFIPIFTSLEELQSALAPEDSAAGYVAMTGYDALNLTGGAAPVAIDPANDHCLYLVPPQIAQILNYFDSIRDPS